MEQSDIVCEKNHDQFDKVYFAKKMMVLFSARLVGYKPFEKQELAVWYRALCDIPPERFDEAISKAVTGLKFFPTIKELRDLAHPEGENHNEAEFVWIKIIGLIESLGSYNNLNLDDRKALKVIKDLGGWVAMCQKSTKQLDELKIVFLKKYALVRELDDLPTFLPGRLSPGRCLEEKRACIPMPKNIKESIKTIGGRSFATADTKGVFDDEKRRRRRVEIKNYYEGGSNGKAD